MSQGIDILVWNDRDNRAATFREIKELIDSGKLFLNQYMEGACFIVDLRDYRFDLRIEDGE